MSARSWGRGLLWPDGRLTDLGPGKPEHAPQRDDAPGARWVELAERPVGRLLGYDAATRRAVRRAPLPQELTDGELAVCALANPQDRGLRAEVVARAGRILSPGGGS